MHNAERLISVSQAAALLGKDVRTVHRWIRRGILPAEKLPGKTAAYILRREDVDALLRDPARAAS